MTDYRKDVSKRFEAVEAANVADVLDEIGLKHQGLASSIQGITSSKIAGWAYTISGHMSPYEGSGDPKKMEACNGIGPNEVSVWSGGGEGICYFGELIAIGMMEKGSTGAVVDGGLRDCGPLEDHGFPVFGSYKTAVQSIGRWKVTDWQKDVYMPGATSDRVVVKPGDFIFGDKDGVVVIPADVVDDVLQKAEEMTQTETEVRAAISSGMTLAEALTKFGHV